jgi:hypothetical protein
MTNLAVTQQSGLTVSKGNGVNIQTIDDLQRVAKMMVMSQFFTQGGDVNTLIAQTSVKIQAGLELGIQPFAAVSGMHIISGKPTLSSGLMASIIKASPKYRYTIVEHTKEICKLECFERDSITNEWLPLGYSSFSMDDAKDAGLATANWKKYTMDMLFARAISRAWRQHFADLMLGCPVYTPDELGATTDYEGNVIQAEVIPVKSDLPPLPFKNPSEAFQWASEKLDCTIEEARSLFESCPSDSQGKKGRVFFNMINERVKTPQRTIVDVIHEQAVEALFDDENDEFVHEGRYQE